MEVKQTVSVLVREPRNYTLCGAVESYPEVGTDAQQCCPMVKWWGRRDQGYVSFEIAQAQEGCGA
jgi:hypothetical protein